MRAAFGAVAVALAVTGVAAALQPVRVHVTGAPTRVVVGAAWTAKLTIRPSNAPRPRVTLRGARMLSATVTKLAAGRYRVNASFPSVGTWQVDARIGTRVFRLRRVTVVPRPYTLRMAAQLLFDEDGRLIVAEQGRNRLIAVDVASGRVSRAVGNVAGPYGLARNGRTLYVSSNDRVLRVSPGAPPAVIARSDSGLDVGPVAVDDAGDVFYFTDGRIYRIDRASGAISPFGGTGENGFGGDGRLVQSATFGRPHGMAFARNGALLLADSENGRVRRVDPATQTVSTIASGLRFPVAVEEARDGSIYVVDFGLGELRRIALDGSTNTVAEIEVPTALALAPDGSFYVAQNRTGRIFRVTAEGSATALALTDSGS